jgi:hypothetical protein
VLRVKDHGSLARISRLLSGGGERRHALAGQLFGQCARLRSGERGKPSNATHHDHDEEQGVPRRTLPTIEAIAAAAEEIGSQEVLTVV